MLDRGHMQMEAWTLSEKEMVIGEKGHVASYFMHRTL
jgi:hypothetical protein